MQEYQEIKYYGYENDYIICDVIMQRSHQERRKTLKQYYQPKSNVKFIREKGGIVTYNITIPPEKQEKVRIKMDKGLSEKIKSYPTNRIMKMLYTAEKLKLGEKRDFNTVIAKDLLTPEGYEMQRPSLISYQQVTPKGKPKRKFKKKSKYIEETGKEFIDKGQMEIKGDYNYYHIDSGYDETRIYITREGTPCNIVRYKNIAHKLDYEEIVKLIKDKEQKGLKTKVCIEK